MLVHHEAAGVTMLKMFRAIQNVLWQQKQQAATSSHFPTNGSPVIAATLQVSTTVVGCSVSNLSQPRAAGGGSGSILVTSTTLADKMSFLTRNTIPTAVFNKCLGSLVSTTEELLDRKVAAPV
jgi:hypothetical protein